MLREEIADAGGSTDGITSDGRSDVVGFEMRGNPPSLATAEDVFVEIDRMQRHTSPDGLASALVDPSRLERALSVYSSAVRPLRARASFRAIVHILSERDFKRTEMREALTRRVASLRPRWRPADPAEMELWCLETSNGWQLGIRLGKTDRTKRVEERHGALRPSVAAAMVRLAGHTGSMVDPMCGTGTIILEARAAGWRTAGSDIDPSAIAIARANDAGRTVVADVLTAPFRGGSFDAVISNLPFGKQFEQKMPVDDAVRAMTRLVSADGCLVLLTARDVDISEANAERRIDVEVLGQPATLWRLVPEG